jgi:hypothetical protein
MRLAPTADPDQMLVHEPSVCRGCGDGLSNALACPLTLAVGEEPRQVFDLPKIVLQAVEHRVRRRACDRCGTVTAGSFPAEAIAPTCYGPNVAAAGTPICWPVSTCLVARAAECLADCFGAPVSTGWLALSADFRAAISAPSVQSYSKCSCRPPHQGTATSGMSAWRSTGE